MQERKTSSQKQKWFNGPYFKPTAALSEAALGDSSVT